MAAVTTLTLTVVGELGKDLRRGLTIRQLAKQTTKPYANTHATVKRLLKENILTKQTVGHSHLCSLNLQNDTTALYVALYQVEQHPKIPPKVSKLDADGNVLLVWKREEDLLVITKSPVEQEFSGEVWVTETELDKETIATLGKHTLLLGHAEYPRLLRRYAE